MMFCRISVDINISRNDRYNYNNADLSLSKGLTVIDLTLFTLGVTWAYLAH